MTTATMTSTSAEVAGAPARPVGFSAALASEWAKLSTLRSTRLMLGLGVLLSIGTTALGSLAMASFQDEWPADLDPITFSMVGNIFALIIFSVFGVLVMTREYSTGMIRLTLTATPRRSRVLSAKLLLVTVITLVLGVATTAGMYLVSQAVLAAYGVPRAGLGDADAWRLVLGLGGTMPFFPVAGLAIGVVLRSNAGAITTVLGLLWLPLIFSGALPLWWQENIVSILPGAALDSFTIAHLVDSPTYLEPVAGAAVATAWLVALAGAAYSGLLRRDA